MKELWCFTDDKIAVRFEYEWHDSSGQWHRTHGNELWHFDAEGLMKHRDMSANDYDILETERRYRFAREWALAPSQSKIVELQLWILQDLNMIQPSKTFCPRPSAPLVVMPTLLHAWCGYETSCAIGWQHVCDVHLKSARSKHSAALNTVDCFSHASIDHPGYIRPFMNKCNVFQRSDVTAALWQEM